MEPLFVPLGQDVIAGGLDAGRNVLAGLAVQGNMGAGYAYRTLCNSQQGYSPPPERFS